MARSADPRKLALWQGRFQRFAESDLPVVRFCAAEDVSESSFYYWQKKLGPTTRRRTTRAADRGVCSEGRRGSGTGRGVFQPVTVVPATCRVVVRLPGGSRIDVGADYLEAIRAVVAETVRGAPDRATEQDVPSEGHLIGKRGGTVSC